VPIGPNPEARAKYEHQRQRKEVVAKVGDDHCRRKHLGREADLSQQVAPIADRAGAQSNRAGKPDPWKQADEEEIEEILHLLLQENVEHQRINQHQQGRIQESPKESKHRATVASFQLALSQAPEQSPVLVKLSKIAIHRAPYICEHEVTAKSSSPA